MNLQIGQLENVFPNVPKVTEVFIDPDQHFLMAELQDGKKVVLAEIVKHAVTASAPKQKRTYKKREKSMGASNGGRSLVQVAA